jgi:uncharacterized protein YndB with AHSA1/START domain
MKIKAHIVDRVMRPISEVFDAIVNPQKIDKYFASEASGPLKVGESITWNFADVDRVISPRVIAVEDNRHIAFLWNASGVEARVDIELEPYDAGSTRIAIVEDGWPLDQEGVQLALQQTAGWTDFVCCMKAYLQFGVNLREGRTRDLH